MQTLHIVGQGLAGTALAWRCHQRGVPFHLYDEPRPATASKVAAGLVTPIAGQRLTLTQGWSFLEEMETFYTEVGAILGQTFYHRHETVRYLAHEIEAARWQKRVGNPQYEAELVPGVPELPESLFRRPEHGFFRMRRSGFLRVNAWLEASRAHFEREGHFTVAGVRPAECDPSAGLWVFANGPWLLGLSEFDWLPMRYAHGDILTLSIPDLGNDQRIFSGAAWLMPLGKHRWRAGSTYHAVGKPTTVPSEDGRCAVEVHIRSLIKCPYVVEDHVAAVRPVTLTRFPIMGQHPGKAHLAWFGGFSSKAVLSAPSYARCFLNHVLDGEPLPPEVEVL